MVEEMIPAGWMFCSADFSIRAGDGTSKGKVMLKRTSENVARWLCLSDELREKHALWLVGDGNTFIEALEAAVWQAKQHPSELPVASYA
jgi:hypothetical protein